jgi:hypothetical protein
MPTQPTCQPPASIAAEIAGRRGYSEVRITVELDSHVVPGMQEDAALTATGMT